MVDKTQYEAMFRLLLSLLSATLVFRILIRPLTMIAKTNKQTMAADSLSAGKLSDHQFELMKLEYDLAAKRYEHIYRAMWQNFSYMAVLSGGILTFGTKEVGPPLAHFLALTPLFFWFIATFIPLEYYGQRIKDRLSDVEKHINQTYFEDDERKLAHYTSFKGSSPPWHVHTIVWIFGVLVTLAWVATFAFSVPHIGRGYGTETPSTTFRLEPQSIRVEVRDPSMPVLRDSVSRMSERMSLLDSLIRLHVRVLDSIVGTRK